LIEKSVILSKAGAAVEGSDPLRFSAAARLAARHSSMNRPAQTTTPPVSSFARLRMTALRKKVD
jgi:hypothetical protein